MLRSVTNPTQFYGGTPRMSEVVLVRQIIVRQIIVLAFHVSFFAGTKMIKKDPRIGAHFRNVHTTERYFYDNYTYILYCS
jgi:hypothetical protein